MGKFPPDQNRLQDSRSVYRLARWKDADEIAGSAFWRKTGKFVQYTDNMC